MPALNRDFAPYLLTDKVAFKVVGENKVKLNSATDLSPPEARNRGRDSVQVACRGAARRKVRRDRAAADNDTSCPSSLEFKI